MLIGDQERKTLFLFNGNLIAAEAAKTDDDSTTIKNGGSSNDATGHDHVLDHGSHLIVAFMEGQWAVFNDVKRILLLSMLV